MVSAWSFRVFAVFLFLGVSGCGYTLQTSSSPALEKEGIRRVYISPILNNTYKSGVENVVYNALIRSLASNQYLRIVGHPEQADAVLSGMVTYANYSASAHAPAKNICSSQFGQGTSLAASCTQGLGATYSELGVATIYDASLSCSFTLTRRNARHQTGQKSIVWTASFGRNKPFPAANQLGTLGTTSALINESEFERTLLEMANSMMGDVRESMLARF